MKSLWEKSTGPIHRSGFRPGIRTGRHHAVEDPEKEDSLQLIGFGVGSKRFCTDIMNVREILRNPVIEESKEAPAFVQGFAQVRGENIPVIDLKKQLDNHPHASPTGSWVVVVRTQKSTIGYIVDSVTRIIKVHAKAILPPPDLILEGMSNPYIQGVCTVDEQLLVVLNFKQMLSVDEEQELARTLDKMTVHQR